MVVVVFLLRAAWRRRDVPGGVDRPAGWATLGVLLTSAWLVPWYAIWLLPLAALGGGPAPAGGEPRASALT